MKKTFKRSLSTLVVAGMVMAGVAAGSPAMAAGINAAPQAAVHAPVSVQVSAKINSMKKTGQTTSALNVRSTTTSKGKKLGTLGKNAKITIVGQDSKTKWFKISYKGKTGFVSNKYVKNVKNATASKPSTSNPKPKPSVSKPKPSNNKAKIKTSYNQKHAGLTYSVMDGGVNWNKKVGKMMYLDGDFYTRGYSKSISEHPTGSKAKAMAKVAADSNMILVIPKIPTSSRGMGYTWWVNSSSNAPKIKSLDSMLDKKIGSNKASTWYMGYSGGSEFISYELAKRGQSGYGNGGAILLAGGGSPRTMTNAPSSFKKSFDMHWFVGHKDGAGQSSNAQTWSAFEASKKGKAFYSSKGFKTSRTVVKADHHSYNIADIMNKGLAKGGL